MVPRAAFGGFNETLSYRHASGLGKAAVNGEGYGIAAGSGPDNRTAVPLNATAENSSAGPDFYELDNMKDVVPLIDSKYRTN